MKIGKLYRYPYAGFVYRLEWISKTTYSDGSGRPDSPLMYNFQKVIPWDDYIVSIPEGDWRLKALKKI